MLCLFVTKKNVNFVGDALSPSHSHKTRPHDTCVMRLRMNIFEKGRARGGGVLTRLKGEKGLSVCLFFTNKTRQFCWRRAESCTLTRTPPPRHRHHAPSDERWEKGRACGGVGLTRLGRGEGHFLAAMKKVKYHGLVLVHRVMHDFYMKINPEAKIGRCSLMC